MKLQDKVAVITGGSRGIGLGCVRVFVKHGATVVFCSDDEAEGLVVEKQFTDEGAAVRFVPADVRVEDDVQRLIDNAAAQHGRLDCLVNNVGWHPPAVEIDDIATADFEALIRLNLTSTFLGCKFAAPHLRKTAGSIINIASKVGLVGQAKAVSYVTTKAAQVGLTKALALDMAAAGVRVNAVCPAGVLTPMMQSWAATLENPDEALAKEDANHPLGRMASIDEIGEVCAFLASDEAAFVTGQAICPDGGAGLGYQRWD